MGSSLRWFLSCPVMLNSIKQRLHALLRFTWGYMGTLAALGLLIGVLGMGIFHSVTRDAEFQAVRCYSGLFNSADPTPPTGLDELAPAAATSSPHLRFEYGKNGRMERLVHICADGHPCAMPGSTVAEQRITYDDRGRITKKANYTATGAPTTDASGVHSRVFRYDDKGNRICTVFLDRSGNPIVPRMPGYAMECITYDDAGRPLEIEYRDGLGNPVTNSRGERKIVFNYDDAHGASSRTNLVDDVPTDNAQGIAREQTARATDGHSKVTSWYTAKGEHAHQPGSGACSVYTEISHDGTLHRERYCEESGSLRQSSTACAEHLTRTAPDGSVEWECFNDADGLPCVNAALGYAERVCEYGRDGALLREYFWDASGNPCERYEKRYCHSAEGEHCLSLLSDGSTELRKIN